MILKTEHSRENYPNGNVRFIQTICYISPDHLDKYENIRGTTTGEYWIRIGRCAKYWENGQLNWELNYDLKGALIKENRHSYRADGTRTTTL